MPSRKPPGSTVMDRLRIYHRLARIPALRGSYARKFAVAAFASAQIPLLVFIVYLLVASSDWTRMYPLLAALVLASVMSFLGTVWLLREILAPVELTANALRDYLQERRLPDLPVEFPDEAGRLMEGTQYTLAQLNATIDRLERVSDTDSVTGFYNRRAGEKRLLEEVARAERDLEPFQVALVELNGVDAIVAAHGHSAGEACVAHLASLLGHNVRRGDWVARWSNDAFLVGLHRSHAPAPVAERLARAATASPCEIDGGAEIRFTVAVGVAEYRFGTGKAGLLGETEQALQEARRRCRKTGESTACSLQELAGTAPPGRAAA